MTQGVLEMKEALKKRVAHGDLAKAAAVVGVNRVVFYEWFYAEKIWETVDARNYNALLNVIKLREEKFKDAVKAA